MDKRGDSVIPGGATSLSACAMRLMSRRANPNGADALAAAAQAADAARERTARFLLGHRLEQLREQSAVRGRRRG